jgi:MtN3 and saliva related transmembrane protein
VNITWVDLIGVAAALCSISSFAPQILKIVREKDASSVSLKTYALTVTTFVLWTAYGVLAPAWPVAAANAIAFMMASAVLGLKWRYR